MKDFLLQWIANINISKLINFVKKKNRHSNNGDTVNDWCFKMNGDIVSKFLKNRNQAKDGLMELTIFNKVFKFLY